jgi:hypothetical protein
LAQAVLAGRADLRNAQDLRADLERGTGGYLQLEAGGAVRDLQAARTARLQAEHDVQHAPRWRRRRAASKDQPVWAEREVDAEHHYQLHVVPEIVRLDRTIQHRRAALEQVEPRHQQYLSAEAAVARPPNHPSPSPNSASA